jgi:hypothetical protein
MAETAAVQQKKRQAKPGTRRVTVNMSEEHYKGLVELSAREMREPNTMLSFMLRGRLPSMLADYQE